MIYMIAFISNMKYENKCFSDIRLILTFVFNIGTSFVNIENFCEYQEVSYEIRKKDKLKQNSSSRIWQQQNLMNFHEIKGDWIHELCNRFIYINDAKNEFFKKTEAVDNLCLKNITKKCLDFYYFSYFILFFTIWNFEFECFLKMWKRVN
jgi:hypothetical protein